MTVGQLLSAERLIEIAIAAAARQDGPRIIASLRAAAVVDPAWSMTAIRMAEIELQTHGPAMARRWLRRAGALEDGNPAAPLVLARILLAEASAARKSADRDRARRCLRSALALTPDGAGALLDLSSVVASTEAATLLERSLALKAWSSPLINLGNLLKTAALVTAALRRFRMAIALEPSEPFAWNNLATAIRDTADVPQALLGYGRALAAAPDAAETESNLLQCLQFDETVDDDALARQHRLWARRHVAAPALGDAAFENRRDPDRRLSIGYVSADLGRHPVGFFLLPAIEAHDRAQVQVTCYATRDLGDELTAALRAASDSWVDASRLDDDALAHRIRADGIDILVDLSGHTAHHRLLVFGRRPAPVQATWLGYFDSCGLEQIDYLLTDDWEVPKTGRDRFIEEVIGLPSGRFAYRPPAYAPLPTRRETRAAIVFGCFNQLAKLSQAAIRVWSRILQARPDARLLLKWSSLADERVADSVRRRFGRHGVAADRLVLRGASDHASMLAEYGDIDIALDPFPFSGCLTTMEALWMGVPAVTLAGRRPVARQSAAILWRLGLADLVTDDEASYVATALALAEDSGRRQRLRTDLRGLMQASTLLDGRACAASLEQAYRIMWRRWCERPVSPAPR